MQANAVLIGVTSTTFGDGTVRDAIDVRSEGGDIIRLWSTNESAEMVRVARDWPMGTEVDLDIDLVLRNGKPGVKLVGVRAA